jgi:hypothetical protein
MTLLDRNCAHLLPYWLPSRGDAEPDLVMVTRQRSFEALSVRLGPQRENAGAIILGSTGSGKTFLFSALLKYGCLNLGGHAVIVDVKGHANSSYRPLCTLLGGQYICLAEDAAAAFNLFPLPSDVLQGDGQLDEAVLAPAVMALCLMAMPYYDAHPDLDYWMGVARTALSHTYQVHDAACGPPILDDVVASLGQLSYAPGKQADVAASMSERLQAFLNSGLRQRLFNSRATGVIDNPFTVFDFAGMQQDPKASLVLLAALTSRIETKMRKLPKTTPKLFGFDEAWKLLETSEAGRQLMSMLYRTARSYGAFCYVITQHENDIAHSSVGQAILSNSSLRFLLRRNDGHAAVAQVFGLDDRQRQLFASLKAVPGPYAEMLLVDTLQARTHVLQYWPTPFDLWCDTSRPSDVAFREQHMAQSGQSWLQTVEHLSRHYPRGAPTSSMQAAS